MSILSFWLGLCFVVRAFLRILLSMKQLIVLLAFALVLVFKSDPVKAESFDSESVVELSTDMPLSIEAPEVTADIEYPVVELIRMKADPPHIEWTTISESRTTLTETRLPGISFILEVRYPLLC